MISLFNIYLSLMFICTLAALKNSSKKKEAEIGKEIVEVFKYASVRRNKEIKRKIWVIKFLTLTLCLSARLTLTFNFLVFIGCFQ